MIHLRANVNHSAAECFHHFDDEEKMFDWISEITGERITSYGDCENWTSKQRMGYIEVLVIDDMKKFMFYRREYVDILNRCDTLLQKSQRRVGKRRSEMLNRFNENYDAACTWADHHPEVWQGEV